MIPIVKYTNDGDSEYIFEDFKEEFLQICESHKSENRASAFAFILFDNKHSNIKKVLKDKSYWDSFHSISGNNLTIFSFHTYSPFNHKLEDQVLYNMVGVLTHDYNDSSCILNQYFDGEEDITLPCLLFFQTSEDEVLDLYLFKLKEQEVDKTYLELRSIISLGAEVIKELNENEYIDEREKFRQLKEAIFLRKFKDKIYGVAKIAAPVLTGAIIQSMIES